MDTDGIDIAEVGWRSALVEDSVSQAIADEMAGDPRKGAVKIGRIADRALESNDRELAVALVQEVSRRARSRSMVRAVLLLTRRAPWPIEGRSELWSWFRADLGPLSEEMERWLARLA